MGRLPRKIDPNIVWDKLKTGSSCRSLAKNTGRSMSKSNVGVKTKGYNGPSLANAIIRDYLKNNRISKRDRDSIANWLKSPLPHHDVASEFPLFFRVLSVNPLAFLYWWEQIHFGKYMDMAKTPALSFGQEKYLTKMETGASDLGEWYDWFTLTRGVVA